MKKGKSRISKFKKPITAISVIKRMEIGLLEVQLIREGEGKPITL